MVFNIAIVGSGPAGFYAAEALLRSDRPVRIDMFDRLPVPFGLVRHGVAPDHQKLKAVTAIFEQIADNANFSFVGNLDIGREVPVSQLQAAYHGVILATGAIADRPLDIVGEDLPGSVSATELVGWYNGHPDFRDKIFDFSHPAAIVIGNGNVALDVCRILAKSVDELKRSDICEHALDALAESRITDVFVIGRRGPAQAKFTAKELREFGELQDAQPVVDPADLQLDAASNDEIECSASAAKNLEILRVFASRQGSALKRKRIHFRFSLAPASIEGTGAVERVKFEKLNLSGPAGSQKGTPTGEYVRIPAGLIVRSVGYRGLSIPGVPFDERSATIVQREGRVVASDGKTVRGLYVAGWIKRGPSGIIGTNRACAIETVESILADLKKTSFGALDFQRDRFRSALHGQSRKLIDFPGWRRIDALERAAGAAKAKPREKLTRVPAMLKASEQTLV
ncbi:FAD-dependent oxidoreductase [Bradyrhizobium lablabi]|uniref:FAD-dependent oxidoreductase n=1 Tax=Bradyrhizobium lablabi TaxID=722472 RepID=UPI001BAA2A4B|nr:FAD-dependent oxidoreductase [Bradyrhizobium lablabi]MBR1123156.1 FAD-dependent oxidoreductase [Bradyrhizobium lablabi]